MLPCQSTSLRLMLRPCFRLYAQHSTLLSVGSMKPDLHMSLSGDVSPYIVHHSAGIAATLPGAGLYPSCSHSSRPFFTSCSVCDVAQQKKEDSEIKGMKFENGEKVQAILSASFEELMTMAEKVESGFLACVILQRLSSLHKDGQTISADGEALLQDSRLKRVSMMIDKQISKLSPKAVLNTLQGLYEMTPTDVYIVKTLVTQMLWMMRRLPIPVVIQVLQLHLQQESSLRREVVQQALMVLERRWVELTNPKDIIYLMYITQEASPLSQGLAERLEDRSLDIVEKASPKELYRIIYLLSRQRHRNTPLIRAIVYHLNKTSVSSLSAVQLTNLVYAMCILNVFDAPVLSKVSAELLNKQADLTPKLVSSLLTSFSRLRWKESNVLQMLMSVLQDKMTLSPPTSQDREQVDDSQGSPHKSSLDVSDQVGLVVSLANLNVDSAQSRDLVEKIVQLDAVQDLKLSSPLLWLDVVWSLVVLQMADATSVASVLSEDFWGKLPSSDSFQCLVNMTKVNNIDSAARYELESYTGPLLPPTISGADVKLLQKGERKVVEKLVSALTNMAPSESYTLLNTTAPGGYLIDAEFYVDGSGNPKPLSQVSENSADYHRIALKVLEFPDLTLPTSDLTGLHAMAVRHLRCQGYKVLQVKHSEMPTKSKVVEVVNFLQQRIKDVVKADSTA